MAKSLLRKANDPRLPPEVVVSAADSFAAHLLLDYAARCEETGRADDAAQARRDAQVVREWQAHNESKPDPNNR